MERNEELAEFERQWKAPRELTRALPRDVGLTKGGIVLTVLGVVFLIAAVVAAIGLGSKATRESAERRLLDAQGVPADAVITRLWRGADKEESPMAAYEFTHNGTVYRHSTRAPWKVWRTLSEGSTVAIRFLPQHPENNMPVDWKGDGPLPAVVPVIAFAIPAFGGLVLLGKLRSDRQLLSEGKAAMGIVRKTHRSSHGQRAVTYEYALPGGSILKKRSGPTRKTLEPGSMVTIIYDPDKPSRSAIYPMELVRVVEMS